METSLFLAKVIGLTGVISTLAIIIRYKLHLEIEESASKDLSAIYSSGFIFLLLGILLTVSHSILTLDWRLIITILSWAMLLKGILRILVPEMVRKLIRGKKNNKNFILAEVIILLICLYLTYKGFQV